MIVLLIITIIFIAMWFAIRYDCYKTQGKLGEGRW